MVRYARWSRRQFTGALGAGAAAAPGIVSPRPATALVNRSGAGGLAPPSNGSFLVPIIRKLELDRKYNLDFDITLYSSPDMLYADLAAERTNHIFGAIYNCANFYLRGIPLQLLFTISTANHAFVAKDPAVAQAADLKGKTVVATTSSGFYGMAILYLRQNGLDPRRSVNVIGASPSAVQTQLLAGKADAALLFDPALSNVLSQGYHLVGDMNADIRRTTKMKADAPIWYLGAYARKDWIEDDPGRAVATLKMWQEAAAFYKASPADADRIVSEFTRLPPETLALSRQLGLTRFDVAPAIAQKDNLDPLFEGFHQVGFLSAIPDDGIYYKWPK
jgi:ABC-type nitrate/sulfonate/bicarbonate transport system substrate-binding protein